MRENQRFTKGLFTWVGFKKKEVPYQVQPRAAGRTTWSYPALLSLAIEGITSFTIAPLRLTTALGLVVSAMAILYMLFVFLNTLIYGAPVAGYPTLMTVLLFLGGVQLLSLGIIGEYLGRVLSLSDVVSSGAAHYLLERLPLVGGTRLPLSFALQSLAAAIFGGGVSAPPMGHLADVPLGHLGGVVG